MTTLISVKYGDDKCVYYNSNVQCGLLLSYLKKAFQSDFSSLRHRQTGSSETRTEDGSDEEDDNDSADQDAAASAGVGAATATQSHKTTGGSQGGTEKKSVSRSMSKKGAVAEDLLAGLSDKERVELLAINNETDVELADLSGEIKQLGSNAECVASELLQEREQLVLVKKLRQHEWTRFFGDDSSKAKAGAKLPVDFAKYYPLLMQLQADRDFLNALNPANGKRQAAQPSKRGAAGTANAGNSKDGTSGKESQNGTTANGSDRSNPSRSSRKK